MVKNDYKEILKKLSSRFDKPDDPKYAILKYVIYVYAFSLPFIIIFSYFNPCFFNLVIPAIAVLVPYFLFKEKSLKKVFIAGIIAVLLVNLTFTAYQIEGIYFSQEPGDLSSDVLSDGTIDNVYGEQKTRFNFTVNLNKNQIQTDNYTVYLNITWLTTTQQEKGNDRSFEMNELNNSRYYYIFNLKEHDMMDRLYSHHFSIKMNTTDGVEWEETDSNFGPFTVSRWDAYQMIMLQQVISSVLFFILVLGMIWWRKRMTTSREKSTEGLEEKEKKLDDYCPECGTLLEDETTCPECGTNVESYLEKKEKMKTKKAIEEVDQLKESDEEEDIYESDETQKEE
ncbi:MAG: hypothetical protein ACOCSL_00790 [Thermoplasmatota archaeon]